MAIMASGPITSRQIDVETIETVTGFIFLGSKITADGDWGEVRWGEVAQSCPTLRSTKLLCPWDFPGKSIGVGCHFLLQGIFLTHGLNPCLLLCNQTLYPLSYQGNPQGQPTALAGNRSLVNCLKGSYAHQYTTNAESERGKWKSWLKAQHSENEYHGIWFHHFMENRWGNSRNSVRLYFWGLQNHCRWWLKPRN